MPGYTARLRTEMTHGDKAKAKTGKSSQASAAKKSPAKGVQAGKGASQEGRKDSAQGRQAAQTGKNGVKASAGSEKAAPAGKKGGGPVPSKDNAAEARAKARPPADTNGGSFSNPLIANAFKRALKKYPNAFRKLTD